MNTKGSTIVTIGTFDGVHIGHQKILNDIVTMGKQLKLRSTVLTLFPHPRMVLQKDSNIKLLNTIEERTEMIRSLGVDHVEVREFTQNFANMSAEDYVKQILVEDLKAKLVVIGYDHRFGNNRSGNIDTLKQFGKQFDFEVKEIRAQQIEDVSVSSTKIRAALNQGDVSTANKYLGYNYAITGKVIAGDQIGRTLNYPTANIHVNASYKLIPKDGVYVVKTLFNNRRLYGMMNIGRNPTIPNKKPSTEVHFFDFNEDLYQSELTVHFLHRLRDEMRFPSLESLKAQLKTDEFAARTYLNQMA